MRKNKTVLAVVAHPDDEVIGVGGTLLTHVKNGDEVNIMILGDGETSREKANTAKREKMAKLVAEKMKCNKLILEKFPDNSFDSVPLLSIAKSIEKAVVKIKPDIVYTHHCRDLNVDHEVTCRAVLTACRPVPHNFVTKIYSFETLSSTEWQEKSAENAFLPNYYQDISEVFRQKLALIKIYAREMREYPHPRSVEGVRILAEYRGMEVGRKLCEAFCLIREIAK